MTPQEVNAAAKAIAHPLRRAAIAAAIGNTNSPNELGQLLPAPLTNISYHVRILAELDVLELADTEPRRGALEHYYRLAETPTATLARALLATAAHHPTDEENHDDQ